MQITKVQLADMLDKAPTGTTPEGIVRAILKQGHTIEDFNPPKEMQAPAPEPKSLVKRAGSLALRGARALGGAGDTLGQALGTSIAKITASKETRPFIDNGPTVPQQIGDVANAVLNTATLGGAGTVGRVGTRVAKTAALGAGIGASKSLERGESPSSVVEDAAVGATGGALMTGAGAALGSAARTFVVKTPRQLANFALRVPQKQASRELNEAFLRRKLGGKSLDQIRTITQKEVETLEEQIQSKLSDKPLIKAKVFASGVANRLKSKTGATVGESDLMARVASFVPDHSKLVVKDVLTEKEANILRRAIDNNLKEATFLGKELTNEQRAIKAYADGLRNLVKKKTGTDGLFKRQSEALGLRNLASQAIDKMETQGRPGLLDITSAGIGFGTGGPGGAALGIAAQRFVRSPRIQGGTARVVRSLGDLEPILKKLAPVEREVILNLISR